MLRIKNCGQILINCLAFGITILLFISLMVHYLYRNQNRQGDDYGSAIDVKKLKAEAELVIVGTIINQRQKIKQEGQGITEETGVSYYEIAVEKVERGSYEKDTIAVAVGWFSSLEPPELYPPFLRKEYHRGDRIRVYVNYDPSELGFYTPALWYTIESVP
jgi:hypothetical protein